MKTFFRMISLLLVFVILSTISIPKIGSAEHDKSITILFTHDLHDHFYPFDVEEDGEIVSSGGYARLFNAIEEERSKDPELVLVDAGDFSMGTLFQTIFASQAPQLRILGEMGYDVLTLGNHEFDFRPEGLADSLNAAIMSGDSLPEIVASNISFPTDDGENLSQSLMKLKKSMTDYNIKDYTILERNNTRIGIFGLMGKDADSNAPMSEVTFPDAIERFKEIVDILKNKEGADLILCLSHSGTSEDKSKSEDEILAEKVPDIDIIISGHSHTALDKPIIINNTLIASYGRYGENLGVIKIDQESDKTWSLNDYKLRPIDSNLDEDESIVQTIESYKAIIQEEYLDQFNMDFDEVLAHTSFNFTSASELGENHEEDRLANLIGDSYIYAIKKAEADNYQPLTAAIIPAGTIRDSFVKGDIRVSDVFTVSSLGIGPDKISGYPLISVYLTGKELKTAAEVDASIAPIMNVAQLYISGLNYKFNPNRLIFNKVTDINIENPDGSKEEIEDDKLYRVAAGLYSAQMLSVVGDKSFGILSVVPKTKDGLPITNYEDHIIYDGDNEVKEWLAIAEYLKSFNKKNNIPQVPAYYKQTQGRKIVELDSNIFSIINKPNKIALTIYLIIGGIIIALISFIVFIIKRKKQKSMIS